MDDFKNSHRHILLSSVKNLAFSQDLQAHACITCGDCYLVSVASHGFVKGRLIFDNLKIRQTRRAKTWSVDFEVDMNKVYDGLSWDFILDMFENLNFSPHQINLIMKCICEVS